MAPARTELDEAYEHARGGDVAPNTPLATSLLPFHSLYCIVGRRPKATTRTAAIRHDFFDSAFNEFHLFALFLLGSARFSY